MRRSGRGDLLLDFQEFSGRWLIQIIVKLLAKLRTNGSFPIKDS